MSCSALLNDSLAEAIRLAASSIKKGGIVAFPTETYYGLAVDPFNEKALQRLYELKKRPSSKPILTLVNNQNQLSLLVRSVPVQYNALMEQFWPGPLTLVFPAKPGVSSILTGNTATVGVRISSNTTAQALVTGSGIPITATSANLSGQKPASCPDEVRQQFGDQIDMVIDGGATPGGKGSTIIGTIHHKLVLIRSGVIPGSVLGGLPEPG